jgi:hypothetical protein
VASANRCHHLPSELGFSTVVGYPAELTAVAALHEALLAHAAKALAALGRQQKAAGTSTRTLRKGFWETFPGEVGERLREAAARAVGEVDEASDQDIPGLLARRDAQVDDASVTGPVPVVGPSRVA